MYRHTPKPEAMKMSERFNFIEMLNLHVKNKAQKYSILKYKKKMKKLKDTIVSHVIYSVNTLKMLLILINQKKLKIPRKIWNG